ncbi:MAG: DNA repair protein RadC [Flavobacteriales bacterium]|nr:DNA repair protein RadC [Flavobacteriales bacterium]MCB0816761.1 DNA repair protein RadC [Flavobacteriales bacterium]
MDPEPNGRLSIRNWAPDDRPRERLLDHGPRALSDAELLAILVRTGSVKATALDLAKEMLHSCGNDLGRLARLSVHDLMRFKGMGQAKAITIAASLELGRRRRDRGASKGPDKVTTSADAYELLRGTLEDLPHEEFWLLLLDRANQVIGRRQVGRGGFHGTVADPKVIFRSALEHQASGIILFHNHPSGQLRPSEADIQLTRKLVAAGRVLDLVVLDHLIVASTGFFSFADQGMLSA